MDTTALTRPLTWLIAASWLGVSIPLAQAKPVTICLASDQQVASGESVLCRRCTETFYERLDALYAAGWQLKVKLRARAEEAYAFYLEHADAPDCPNQATD